MWNTRPNNGGIPTPLDHLASSENMTSGVYLAKATLSRWCQIHKMSRYSELDCPEFQIATEIFQVEVQNVIDSASCRDIVPSKPYDSSYLVVNQAPFPQSDHNEPEIKAASTKNKEVQDVSNEETLSQLFDLVHNGPLDEEESDVDEVHMFHQRTMTYFLRNREAGGPFTRSTPPNPNANNNLGFPHVPTQYLNKDRPQNQS